MRFATPREGGLPAGQRGEDGAAHPPSGGGSGSKGYGGSAVRKERLHIRTRHGAPRITAYKACDPGVTAAKADSMGTPQARNVTAPRTLGVAETREEGEVPRTHTARPTPRIGKDCGVVSSEVMDVAPVAAGSAPSQGGPGAACGEGGVKKGPKSRRSGKACAARRKEARKRDRKRSPTASPLPPTRCDSQPKEADWRQGWENEWKTEETEEARALEESVASDATMTPGERILCQPDHVGTPRSVERATGIDFAAPYASNTPSMRHAPSGGGSA